MLVAGMLTGGAPALAASTSPTIEAIRVRGSLVCGMQADNVDSLAVAKVPEFCRLLGLDGEVGATMGLHNAWAARATKAVGNDGEVWEHSVAPIGLARGLNKLWDPGGLQYAPPLR
jgi:general L-amino acid transport system substrate-binding protein